MKKILETLKRKWAEYLLEILVIVIGILGAFILNNWNESRKASNFQHKILNEIHISLLENIEIVKRSIFFNENAKTSCQIILNHFKENLPYQDSLDRHFAHSLFWFKVSANYSAYETAESYGLHILKNDSIRILLSSVYEGTLELIAAFERRNHDFFYQNIIPVTRDLFESTNHGILLPTLWKYEGNMKPLDYSELKNHQRYIHIIKTLNLNRERDLTFLRRLKREMNELEKMIKTELYKK